MSTPKTNRSEPELKRVEDTRQPIVMLKGAGHPIDLVGDQALLACDVAPNRNISDRNMRPARAHHGPYRGDADAF